MEQKYDHSCSYQFRLHELSKNKGSGFEIKKTHFAPAKKKKFDILLNQMC